MKNLASVFQLSGAHDKEVFTRIVPLIRITEKCLSISFKKRLLKILNSAWKHGWISALVGTPNDLHKIIDTTGQKGCFKHV